MEKTHKAPKEDDVKDEYQELLQTLEQKRNWDGRWLFQYKGFWFPDICFRGFLSILRHFKARDTDILLASMPKSGTNWMKSLLFSIITRKNNSSMDQSPLLTATPRALVRSLEFNVYRVEDPDLETIPSPRIFSTHIPCNLLPNSIFESKCRVVYICRNPLDQFVSHWHFLLPNAIRKDLETPSVEEAFELYCNGVHRFGPFCDHVMGYWSASLSNSEKVLFLKYEDLKEDIIFSIKKIADFIGFPFSEDEEKQGLIE